MIRIVVEYLDEEMEVTDQVQLIERRMGQK
jgi:hypothetical protein